jgi:hypothetical protein
MPLKTLYFTFGAVEQRQMPATPLKPASVMYNQKAYITRPADELEPDTLKAPFFVTIQPEEPYEVGVKYTPDYFNFEILKYGKLSFNPYGRFVKLHDDENLPSPLAKKL